MLNLTPHPCTIIDDDETIAQVEPSGSTLRVEEERAEGGEETIDGADVPVVSVEYGGLAIDGDLSVDEVREADAVYVSGYVAGALDDCDGEVGEALLDGSAYTAGQTVRDDDGRIQGIASLERIG